MNTNDFIRKEDGKIVIPVPPGIRYMSEWTDFNLNFFGVQPFIVDKQIPGCGFTEYCLTSNDDIILTSPRRLLLENKEDQHEGEIYYFKNGCDESSIDLTEDTGVDKDISKLPIRSKSGSTPVTSRELELLAEDKEEKEDDNDTVLTKMELKLLSYINERKTLSKSLKIIVTYDSFKHLKRYLRKHHYMDDFKIVVDEFQSIFVDSRFKATTEFSFLNELRDVSNQICFVSATPMMDKYLMKLDYFKGLPYFELDWGLRDPARVMKPELKVRKTQSINSELKRIIREYKECSEGRRVPDHLANPTKTNEIVYSTEAVFYVNSVNNILSIIKSEGLRPEEVNILCSNTKENRNKIEKRLGKKFLPEDEDKIGEVPLRGQPHKMFTFCTRTVYLGADFYSTCAKTFILSDANIDSLAVDISLDLPQILGRQRLIENPWKNHAEFYFKSLGTDKKIIESEFNKLLEEKLRNTENTLSLYSKGSEEEKRTAINIYKGHIIYENYRNDYVSLDYDYDSKTFYPVKNELVFISEQRAFDIQQVDYADRFSVFSSLSENSGTRFDEITDVINSLRDTTSKPFTERLKELCESNFPEEVKKTIAQQVSEKFDKYYNILGPERCKANGYRPTDLEREIKALTSKDNITREFCIRFKVGERYTNADAKAMVGKLYEDLGLSHKTPKATDIFEYFEVKRVSMFDENRKKINGIELQKNLITGEEIKK